MISSTVPSPEIRLELRSNPLYLSGAREMVAAVARRLGFTEEACGQIALAVDEALCNVIRHGYDRAADKPIWISLWPLAEPAGAGGLEAASGGASGGAGGGMSEAAGAACCRATPDASVGALRIVIDDEARQVDPGVIKSRDLDEVRPGGLGVHIIRAVMDDVKYEKRTPVGMRLSMMKRRASAPSDPPQRPATAMGSCTIQCVSPSAPGGVPGRGARSGSEANGGGHG